MPELISPEVECLTLKQALNICCAKPLLTPFCPMCGKANKDPALELVTFLRTKIASYRTQANARASNKAAAQTCTDKANRMEGWADRIIELAHLEPLDTARKTL